MPIYEYICDANGETVEIKHGMDFVVRDPWARRISKPR
jgi:predicted nucleic acid-binding Zn ribbon protein